MCIKPEGAIGGDSGSLCLNSNIPTRWDSCLCKSKNYVIKNGYGAQCAGLPGGLRRPPPVQRSTFWTACGRSASFGTCLWPNGGPRLVKHRSCRMHVPRSDCPGAQGKQSPPASLPGKINRTTGSRRPSGVCARARVSTQSRLHVRLRASSAKECVSSETRKTTPQYQLLTLEQRVKNMVAAVDVSIHA